MDNEILDEEFLKQMNPEIRELLLSRKRYFEENYPKVREIYQNHYDWLELDPVRHEICIALTLGLHQASITLTNHLMESMLKYGLIYDEYFKLPELTEVGIRGREITALDERFAPLFNKFGDMNLYDTINDALRCELIDEEQKNHLHHYRERFRNAFSHSDKRKTFGISNVPVQNLHFDQKEGIQKGESATPQLATFIVGQGIAQAEIAKQDAIPYFLDIDSLVRQIRVKVFAN